MSETAAAMHLEPAGKAAMPCEVCGEPFTPKRASWAKFCSTRCRNAHHGAQARVEKIKDRAVELYDALTTARDLLRGLDLEHAVINHPELPQVGLGQLIDKALAGLKPPVDPKDLLKA